MTYDDYGEETRNSIMLEFGHERVRREELKEQCVSILTTIHVCLIMAKMMDYAKKTVNENADGIEDWLKNPNDKGKYINGDNAKQEKGLNAILDDAKITFEKQAEQMGEYLDDETYSSIRDNVNEISNGMSKELMDMNSMNKAESVAVDGKRSKTKTMFSLFNLLIVSQLLKGASEMVEDVDIKYATQTAVKKIDEIDFGPLKKGKFAEAYEYASSEGKDLIKGIGQIVRDEMGMIL